MSGTRLIFHLSDEDDDLDVGVATLDPSAHPPLDASWPEETSHTDRLPEDSERDDVELLRTPEAPAFGLGAQSVQDPSEPERGVSCEPEPGPKTEEDTYVLHRALPRRAADLFLRARSGRPRLPQRAFAFGALAALAVLVVMIVVHSPRPASVASAAAPTYAAGAARSESALSTPVPVGGESARRRVGPSEPRPAHTHRAHQKARAPVTLRSAATATATRFVQASTPAPAPDVARSVPVPQSAIHSPSASYTEFSFER